MRGEESTESAHCVENLHGVYVLLLLPLPARESAVLSLQGLDTPKLLLVSHPGMAVGPFPLQFRGVQIPTNKDHHRLFGSCGMARAQLHPLVHTLDNDGCSLMVTPQDALKAHELMAAAFDNEQQPEFEPIEIQGG